MGTFHSGEHFVSGEAGSTTDFTHVMKLQPVTDGATATEVDLFVVNVGACFSAIMIFPTYEVRWYHRWPGSVDWHV